MPKLNPRFMAYPEGFFIGSGNVLLGIHTQHQQHFYDVENGVRIHLLSLTLGQVNFHRPTICVNFRDVIGRLLSTFHLIVPYCLL